MSVCGIVAEYNPLHNGHFRQMAEIRRQLGGDASIVAVMSGNFVQRGEPAIADKFARAGIALQAGADIVLELPADFAVSSAERFAASAVSILRSAGVVDYISFGAECGDLDALSRIAGELADEGEAFRDGLHKAKGRGLAFPRARAEACEAVIPGSAAVLRQPNNILAVEYLKAIIRQGAQITPLVIKRGEASEGEPSATMLREAILTGGGVSAVSAFMPDFAAAALGAEIGRVGANSLAAYYDALRYALLRESGLAEIREVTEGLENRMRRAALPCGGVDEMLDAVMSSRYTRSKIRRIFLHLLLSQRRSDELASPLPRYIRALGFRRASAPLLSRLAKEASVPVIVNPKHAGRALAGDARGLADFNREAAATDIYNLGLESRRPPLYEYRAAVALV